MEVELPRLWASYRHIPLLIWLHLKDYAEYNIPLFNAMWPGSHEWPIWYISVPTKDVQYIFQCMQRSKDIYYQCWHGDLQLTWRGQLLHTSEMVVEICQYSVIWDLIFYQISNILSTKKILIFYIYLQLGQLRLNPPGLGSKCGKRVERLSNF